MVLALAAFSSTALAKTEQKILVMGDSLSAAYGMAAEQGWVHLLQQKIAPAGWRVINASVSGETTAGGKSRIETALAEHQPAIVLIELGANDGLRGLPLDLARRNLAQMIKAAQAAKAKVLLIGMQIPPNYGPDYTQQFIDMYRSLSLEHEVALLPFLLQPIANSRDAFLPDQLHPNVEAQPALAEHVLAALNRLIGKSHRQADSSATTP